MSDDAKRIDGARIVVPRESLISRYELIGRLGSGGMAEVFLARAQGIADFEKVVVLKRVHPDKRDDARFIGMLRDEARIAAILDHPNIVQTYDVGIDDGGIFIVMEYLDGQDLKSILDRVRAAGERIPLPLVLQIAVGAAAGLHHAHDKTDSHGCPLALVHRDVSPCNVIVTRHGGVKLIDFGIAKAESRPEHTAAGTLKGKVAYMSPEQVRGEAIDRRSDIFSLGILIYEMATMARPFDADNNIAAMHQVCEGRHRPAHERRPDLPPALSQLIDRCLAKDPARRYATALEVQKDLERITRDCDLHALPGALARYLEHVFGPALATWMTPEKVRARLDRAPAQPEKRTWDLAPGPVRVQHPAARRGAIMLGATLGFTGSALLVGLGWLAWPTGERSDPPPSIVAADLVATHASIPERDPAARPAAEAAALLDEAARLTLDSRDAEALPLIEASLRLRETSTGYAKLAIAACRLRLPEKARQAHGKLEGKRAGDVAKACAAHGVTL